MAHFVDRRLNPKAKSLGNRQRFIQRVRGQIKQAVDESIRKRAIADIDRSGGVSVSADGLAEPQFHHSSEGGQRERVLPGNKVYRTGDRIDKPPSGGGGGGKRGAPDGEGTDQFAFVLSREEFLDIFFEDLELPDLVKNTLQTITATKPRRAGYSATGSPGNLNVQRTMRNAFGRRLALRRPSEEEVAVLQFEIARLEALADPDEARLAELRRDLETLLRRQKLVPYLDPIDVRYKHFEHRPEPKANAVMFCLMDVSASMGEREKDLAKRFFVLLHLFLSRRYDRVEIVFIRHTHVASEVDEETFFNSRETGGTVVSTALAEMIKVVAARYSPQDWNIYAAQASDGDNHSGDSANCREMLNETLMRYCQYFAYVEIISEVETQFLKSDGNGTELWMAYRAVAEAWPNFAMKRIARGGDIYPVFRELFSRQKEAS